MHARLSSFRTRSTKLSVAPSMSVDAQLPGSRSTCGSVIGWLLLYVWRWILKIADNLVPSAVRYYASSLLCTHTSPLRTRAVRVLQTNALVGERVLQEEGARTIRRISQEEAWCCVRTRKTERFRLVLLCTVIEVRPKKSTDATQVKAE